MTCSNCGQYFLYDTGEVGGHCGHVTKIETPKDKIKLSIAHFPILNELGLVALMTEIESLEPKTTDAKTLTNILTNYYQNNQILTPQLEFELAIAFEKYIIKIHTNKRYHQAINEIESHIFARTISSDYLQQILAILMKLSLISMQAL